MARLMMLALAFCFLPFAAAESGVPVRYYRYQHWYKPPRPHVWARLQLLPRPKVCLPPLRGEEPLSEEMKAKIARLGMEVRSRILMRIFKKEKVLEVWKQTLDGTFAPFETYPICAMSGGLGPKMHENDRQSPEGFYPVRPTQMHTSDTTYLTFSVGYPNTFDKANGRTGSFIMVHGVCASIGCFAMTNKYMTVIYALAREAFAGGQKEFQVHIFPFRMTPENMIAYQKSPHIAFWRKLKEGYDRFERTHEELPIEVCEKQYVFDAYVADDPDQQRRSCQPLEPSDK